MVALPSTWEMEAEGSVQGQPQLHSKFEGSLGPYESLSWKIHKQNKTNTNNINNKTPFPFQKACGVVLVS